VTTTGGPPHRSVYSRSGCNLTSSQLTTNISENIYMNTTQPYVIARKKAYQYDISVLAITGGSRHRSGYSR
jgi:hypothetical protein